MKYFLDTEFIEGFNKPLFGKNRHFIDLISLAIVCEDGRSLYLISNEYEYNKADDWVKENVILPMYIDTVHGDMRNSCDVNNFHKIYGISNKEIAQSVFEFCTQDILTIEKAKYYDVKYENIEFYGYYSDYDWVLFCSLFGKMIDLPNGFPMYCKDLKQEIDNFCMDDKRWSGVSNKFKQRLEIIKEWKDYPKQENEHNALDDAKWNFELFKFLKSL